MSRALPSRTSLPIIFAIAFATGFSGAVTPGSLLLVVVQKSVQYGWPAGPVLMIGHSLLELLAVVLLVTGLLAFARSRVVRGLIGLVGGLVLVWLGYMSLGIDAHAVLRTMAASRAGGTAGIGASAGVQLVGLGAVMSAINPYWWLWWATIGTAHIGWATQRGRSGGATYWVGHILADIVWYSALSIALGAGRTLLSAGMLRGIYVVTAAFLALLGVMFAISGMKALRAREEPVAAVEAETQVESV